MDRVFVGQNVSDLDTSARAVTISRVTLKAGGDEVYTAGDDTGRTVEKTCLWASQALADSLLARLRRVSYQPFSGEEALLDPAAEVGDGITAGGVYAPLYRTDIVFDGLYTADAAAPGSDEIEDEYPYKSRARRQADRELSQTYSRITKTAEEIRLEVANDLRGLSSSITVKLESITQLVEDTENGLRSEFTVALSGISPRVSNAEGDIASLDQTARSLTTRISSAEGDVSSLEQFADSLTIDVSNSSDSSTLRLMAGRTELASREIRFTGMVTFSDLWGNETIINGSTIDTSTLFLDSLYGDSIYLRDDQERIAVEFRVTGASTAQNACDIWARSMRINSYPGDIYLNCDNGASLQITDAIQAAGDVIPNAPNRYSCGTYGFPWSDVYSTDGTISSSDKAGKFDIDYDMSRYSPLFDALRPCSFRRTGGDSFRAHTGLIAQDVAEARNAAGLPGTEFAAFCSWDMEGGSWGCGLRYEEFIALLIYEVQALKKQVKDLKGETA